jgi:hypothetical protein
MIFIASVLPFRLFHFLTPNCVYVIFCKLHRKGTINSTVNIVLRSITEDFWEKVVSTTEKPKYTFRVCAVGTPGVGKTTATPILIRLLLLMKRNVFYHIRSLNLGNWVYEFTPVQATEGGPITVKVNVIRENEFFYQDIESHSQEGLPNYYVVDPGKTKDNCDVGEDFKGRFILVSSPDNHHWGGSQFEKAQDTSSQGTFRYFPLWDLDELMAARPYINIDISDQEVKQRHHQVGGVPRNVFAGTEEYSKVLKRQEEDIRSFDEDQLKEISSSGWDAVSTFFEQQPKSAIMGYGRSAIDYTVKNVQCISNEVQQALFVTSKSIFWAEYCQISDNESDVKSAFFKTTCRHFMVGPPFLTDQREPLRSKNNNTSKVTLGGCSHVVQTIHKLEDAAKDAENVLFHPYMSTYPLIDSMYQNGEVFFAFQAMCQQKKVYDVNAAAIRELAKKVGGPEKLHLYYLVPTEIFNSFKTKPLDLVAGIKKLIRQDIAKVSKKIEKIKQHSGEINGEQTTELNEAMIQLQIELNSTWTIYVVNINNPKTMYQEFMGNDLLA